MFSKDTLTLRRLSGFTIIELLISVAIIGIVTSIVVVKYSGFNSAVLLRNQAYEVALAIREAQVFSVSIRAGGSDFRDNYGVYFNASTPQTFQVFVDGNQNDEYDSGEEVDTLVLDSRFEISDLQGCDSSCSSVNELSIAFKRPNFDAFIFDDGGVRYGYAEIHLQGITDSSITRVVTVRSAGNISVQ